MNDWNIQSRAHACQVSGHHFADKEPFYTLLYQDKHELKRLDVSVAAWTPEFSAEVLARKGYISHWKGIYEAPPPAPPDAIQKDTAETLLRKLIEANDPTHSAACYILAVMLERKRILKVKEQIKIEGRRVFIYEQPKTGDLFTIADPDLQLNQLDAVQRDVANLLEHGLNPPTTADAAPTTPTDESAPAPEAEQPQPVPVA